MAEGIGDQLQSSKAGRGAAGALRVKPFFEAPPEVLNVAAPKTANKDCGREEALKAKCGGGRGGQVCDFMGGKKPVEVAGAEER